ncbi:hypothetical protein ACKTEK_12815 [Tepidamorphus sp. 3E244]|uniref:hypothetical protein n=1 Tax=Tepidamorphus sp. 3E244 TaxID=3385498 RepID=UPI0038FD3546
MPQGIERLISNRKTRDRAAILLLIGIVLFMPPFARAALMDTQFAGIPLPVFYIFAVWIGLVVAAAAIAGPLARADEPAETGETPEGDG